MAAKIIEFIDNDGNRRQMNYTQCEEYMVSIGMAENNKRASIAHRHKHRDETGLTNRQIMGLDDKPDVRRSGVVRRHRSECNPGLSDFLRTKLA